MTQYERHVNFERLDETSSHSMSSVLSILFFLHNVSVYNVSLYNVCLGRAELCLLNEAYSF